MTYLQPNHTSNMKHFQELVNNFKSFIIFAESSTVDQVLAMALYLKEKYVKEIDFPGDYFQGFGRLIFAWTYFYGCQMCNIYIQYNTVKSIMLMSNNTVKRTTFRKITDDVN